MKRDFLSVKESELVTFFEVASTFPDGEQWPYKRVRYAFDAKDIRVTCTIEPAGKDVHIILERNGSRMYELNATGVFDVRYTEDKRGEMLEVVLSEAESIELRVRPLVEIRQIFEHTCDAP